MPAIKAGKVKEATIDEKVKRILRIMFRFGFFDNEQLDSSIPSLSQLLSQASDSPYSSIWHAAFPNPNHH